MAERVMVGTGSCEKDSLRAVVKRWELETTGGRRKAKAQRMDPAMMSTLGIGYRVVKQANGH